MHNVSHACLINANQLPATSRSNKRTVTQQVVIRRISGYPTNESQQKYGSKIRHCKYRLNNHIFYLVQTQLRNLSHQLFAVLRNS